MSWPGIEPDNKSRKSNVLTTTPPRHLHLGSFWWLVKLYAMEDTSSAWEPKSVQLSAIQIHFYFTFHMAPRAHEQWLMCRGLPSYAPPPIYSWVHSHTLNVLKTSGNAYNHICKGSELAGDFLSHPSGGRLPLLSARPASLSRKHSPDGATTD